MIYMVSKEVDLHGIKWWAYMVSSGGLTWYQKRWTNMVSKEVDLHSIKRDGLLILSSCILVHHFLCIFLKFAQNPSHSKSWLNCSYTTYSFE